MCTTQDMRVLGAVAEASPVMIWTTDATNHVNHVNRAWRQFFGVAEANLSEIDWRQFVHPEDYDIYVSGFAACAARREEFRARCRARRADGQWRWLSAHGAPYFVGDVWSGMVGSSMDITEQVEAEALVRESEARFRHVLEHSPVIVFTMDDQLRYTWIHNEHATFDTQCVIGRRDEELLPPDEAEALTKIKRSVLTSGVGLRTEHAMSVAGFRHIYDLKIDPIHDPDGAIVGLRAAAVDVTERKRLEEALRSADRQKEELLAIVAHEIRNSLSPMTNAVQLLKRAATLEDRRIEILERQLSHLKRIVDDLLDIARSSAGKIELRKKTMRIDLVARTTIETVSPQVQAKQHRLKLHVPEQPVFVFADEVRICQVLVNLLHNAVKFTPAGGTIEVEVRTEGNEAVVSVRDTGIGLAADKQMQVFAMFGQLTTPAGQAGLGIGLTLCKRLVELHGGSIAVRSEGPGHGSEFLVRLPLARAPSRSQASELSDDDAGA